MTGLDLLGAEGTTSLIGSQYYDEATAGDGTKIRAGSRVVFKKGSRSLWAYGAPDPPEGAVGRVSGSMYEFRREIWAHVEFPDAPPPHPGTGEKAYSVRVKELVSADAPVAEKMPAPAAGKPKSATSARTAQAQASSLTDASFRSHDERDISSTIAWAGGLLGIFALALAAALRFLR